MASPSGRSGFALTEIAALLAGGGAALAAEVESLPEAVRAWRPAPGEWCVKEVLGHLIEAEQRGFAGRIRLMLIGDAKPLQAWDQNEVARARRDHERDAGDLLREFGRLREASVTLVRSLREADRERGADHPKVGWLSVDDVLHEWVHHDRNHLKQMMANVQAYAWPHMGNAQKFAGE